MKFLILLALIVTPFFSFNQNRYVGKWVAYDIKSFNKEDSTIIKDIDDFESYIIFNEDMTFEKHTQGKITYGKYEFTDNKFKFLELDGNNNYYPSWRIRWYKNTLDPSPSTPNIDLNYPELFEVYGQKYEWDVYYIKED